MVSSMPGVGDVLAVGRGSLLYLKDITNRTQLAEGTVRSKYHAGTMPCVWKLGRRLVAWEADLEAWLAYEQERTTKRGRQARMGPYEALVEECPDLDALRRLLAREEAIRGTMAATGESREQVIEMMAAFDSMGQEAVLDLTEGGPTTLRDALRRLVNGYAQAPGDADHVEGLIGHLANLLEYPFPGADELIIDDEDDDHFRISVNGVEVATVNHDEHGRAGMAIATEVAKAVFNRVAQ